MTVYIDTENANYGNVEDFVAYYDEDGDLAYFDERTMSSGEFDYLVFVPEEFLPEGFDTFPDSEIILFAKETAHEAELVAYRFDENYNPYN